jgi:hypothetical protein
LLPSAWKYWSLKPFISFGVSMVAGGEPTGMLRFQVERSIMAFAFLQKVKALARRPDRFFIGGVNRLVKWSMANYWRQGNAKKPCFPGIAGCSGLPLVGFLKIGAMMAPSLLLLFWKRG